MHSPCMGTKTISLSTEAYERLSRARLRPKESFSQVVLRAVWPPKSLTGGDLLDLCRSGRFRLPDDAAATIERLKAEDRPPEDKWRAG